MRSRLLRQLNLILVLGVFAVCSTYSRAQYSADFHTGPWTGPWGECCLWRIAYLDAIIQDNLRGALDLEKYATPGNSPNSHMSYHFDGLTTKAQEAYVEVKGPLTMNWGVERMKSMIASRPIELPANTHCMFFVIRYPKDTSPRYSYADQRINGKWYRFVRCQLPYSGDYTGTNPNPMLEYRVESDQFQITLDPPNIFK
jgi:hypothetical protein